MKIMYTVLAFLLISIIAYSQAPSAFSYQALARDASGEILINTTVGLEFKLHQTTIDGPVVYSEIHSPTTNGFGVFNVIVGQGSSTEFFENIAWGADEYFLETSLDLTNGSDYMSMGTSQLLSVPYALDAKIAAMLRGFPLEGDLPVSYGSYLYWDNTTNSWRVGDTNVHIGQNAGEHNQTESAIAIGMDAGKNDQSNGSVAIGQNAGTDTQLSYAIAIGKLAGEQEQRAGAIALGLHAGKINQGEAATAVGVASGYENQGVTGIAIGAESGNYSQGTGAISVGRNAGNYSQGTGAIAIGSFAGDSNQGYKAIALGDFSGRINQGSHAIAIGVDAGYENQASNSIIIDAADTEIVALTAGLYIAPIREAFGTKVLQYNSATKEITAANSTKMNYSATVPPTINDDINSEYIPGSMWIDVIEFQAYICIDHTAGAALWKKITL